MTIINERGKGRFRKNFWVAFLSVTVIGICVFSGQLAFGEPFLEGEEGGPPPGIVSPIEEWVNEANDPDAIYEFASTYISSGYLIYYFIYENDPYDRGDAKLYWYTMGTGNVGDAVTAPMISILGHRYINVPGLSQESGTISSGLLQLYVYFEKTGMGQWSIRGASADATYDGSEQRLGDLLDGAPLYSVTWPSDVPGDEYALAEFVGGSYIAYNYARDDIDPVGTYADDYHQSLALGADRDWRVLHRNPSMENQDPKRVMASYNGLEWSDVTTLIDYPAVSNGKLTIGPAPVTITVDDAWKLFGRPDPEFTGEITAGALTDEDDLGEIGFVRSNADTEDVGVYGGALTATYMLNPNYDVTVVPGDFEIRTNSEDFTVTLLDGTAIYDGNDHMLAEAVASLEGAAFAYTYDNISSSTMPVFSTAGTYRIMVTAGLEGYDNATDSATLTITQRSLTITAGSVKKHYDGRALKTKTWRHSAGSLADGDRISSVNTKGSQIKIGKGVNKASGAIIVNKESYDVTSSYQIAYKNGTLTVTDSGDGDGSNGDGNGGGSGGGGGGSVGGVGGAGGGSGGGASAASGGSSGENPPVVVAPSRDDNNSSSQASTSSQGGDASASTENAPSPTNEVSIPVEQAPVSSFSTWALINLILTGAVALIAALLMAGYFRRGDDEEEEEAAGATGEAAEATGEAASETSVAASGTAAAVGEAAWAAWTAGAASETAGAAEKTAEVAGAASETAGAASETAGAAEKTARTAGAASETADEQVEDRRLGLRLLAVVAAAGAIVLFFLTQNLKLPMGFIDSWTAVHVAITVTAILLAIFSQPRYEEEEEDEPDGAENDGAAPESAQSA